MGLPAPIPGASLLLGGYGKLFKQPPVFAASGDQRPSFVAVIPALNEETTIPYAIASLARQTVTPDRLVVVDDGSTDATASVVEELGTTVDFPVELVRHDEPNGKTPSIKEIARSASEEAFFVLDADTYLESETYLEKLLAPHGEPDVACSFGLVRPSTRSKRREFYRMEVSDRVAAESPLEDRLESELDSGVREGLLYRLSRWPVEKYRGILYDIEQRFTKDASMRLFETTMFPAGCGVMYNRKSLVSVFDEYEQSLGDDLTNSEDIFLGYAFVDRGLSNVQVDDVTMRTLEPSLRKFVSQSYLWGSAYLQSAYYFKQSTFKLRRKDRNSSDSDSTDRSTPAVGRAILAQLVDGLYPVALIVVALFVLLQVIHTEWLVSLVAVEYGLYAAIAMITTDNRLKALSGVLVSIPVRIVQLVMGAYTYLRVGADLVSGNRDWRK